MARYAALSGALACLILCGCSPQGEANDRPPSLPAPVHVVGALPLDDGALSRDSTALAQAAAQAAMDAAALMTPAERASLGVVHEGPPQPQFYGYQCVDDCEGHEAGYAWAEENEVTDALDCGGKSQSFIEGCEAFAGEQDEAREEAEEEAASDMRDAEESEE